MLACVGSRCGISTKAIPVSAGSASSNFRKASSPPAEAPIPTTGKAGLASSLVAPPARRRERVRRSGFVAPSGTGLLRLLPVKGVTTLLIASRPKIKGIRTRLVCIFCDNAGLAKAANIKSRAGDRNNSPNCPKFDQDQKCRQFLQWAGALLKLKPDDGSILGVECSGATTMGLEAGGPMVLRSRRFLIKRPRTARLLSC